ncbi:hypothetical protein [Kribbella steppae]|uniref:hypothetical protein n=1 Tax=Kribbella steppae TaxID=2512223 RepID=UPI001043F3D9|nr:hypothetical protein [Kribbella steppae]
MNGLDPDDNDADRINGILSRCLVSAAPPREAPRPLISAENLRADLDVLRPERRQQPVDRTKR